MAGRPEEGPRGFLPYDPGRRAFFKLAGLTLAELLLLACGRETQPFPTPTQPKPEATPIQDEIVFQSEIIQEVRYLAIRTIGIPTDIPHFIKGYSPYPYDTILGSQLLFGFGWSKDFVQRYPEILPEFIDEDGGVTSLGVFEVIEQANLLLCGGDIKGALRLLKGSKYVFEVVNADHRARSGAEGMALSEASLKDYLSKVKGRPFVFPHAESQMYSQLVSVIRYLENPSLTFREPMTNPLMIPWHQTMLKDFPVRPGETPRELTQRLRKEMDPELYADILETSAEIPLSQVEAFCKSLYH